MQTLRKGDAAQHDIRLPTIFRLFNTRTVHMDGYLQVVTTLETEAQALDLARQLVEERLAACAQVDGPLTSVYHWQGEVETATEYRLTLKTRADLYPDLAARLGQLHPYEVPELLALPVVRGHAPYLQWMDQELARRKS